MLFWSSPCVHSENIMCIKCVQAPSLHLPHHWSAGAQRLAHNRQATPLPLRQKRDCSLSFTADQVRWELGSLLPGKVAGPDGVSPSVLKTCASQLQGVFQLIFNMSMRLERVPELCKTYCLVPVLKKGNSSAPNDYRPLWPSPRTS
ncbi:hypothetical protein SKAU_G00263950 [Synaphobranchus kaupii]|uniref:Reverse transcriptase n=1 Tax=Synaphobranchus kaupii TaxID=118154 RepID=A0A9Q1IPW7_SYNKA|nr:hypothetical protein SKAU_G00263950 [Synaphobranchus kaupii]